MEMVQRHTAATAAYWSTKLGLRAWEGSSVLPTARMAGAFFGVALRLVE